MQYCQATPVLCCLGLPCEFGACASRDEEAAPCHPGWISEVAGESAVVAGVVAGGGCNGQADLQGDLGAEGQAQNDMGVAHGEVVSIWLVASSIKHVFVSTLNQEDGHRKSGGGDHSHLEEVGTVVGAGKQTGADRQTELADAEAAVGYAVCVSDDVGYSEAPLDDLGSHA